MIEEHCVYSKDVLKRTRQYVIIVAFLSVLFVVSLTPARLRLLDNQESPTAQSPDAVHLRHLVEEARKKANCTKPASSREYVICEELPFTKIECGKCADGCPKSSQNGSAFRIPNVVHFIWFGNAWNLTSFIQYLAVRSIASIQRPDKIYIHLMVEAIYTNELLNRLLNEIPCLHLRRYHALDQILSKKIKNNMYKSDFARLEILQTFGGIYLDFDVITMRPLSELRIHQSVVGRCSIAGACNGVILSERNSKFINEWLMNYQLYDPQKGHDLGYWALNVPFLTYLQFEREGIVYMDESINRPNPFTDSPNSTTFGHYSIKDNYFLHVHPREAKGRMPNFDLGQWREERLRTLDSTYGQAARTALFGSSDLVFRKDEKVYEPKYENTAEMLGSPDDKLKDYQIGKIF